MTIYVNTELDVENLRSINGWRVVSVCYGRMVNGYCIFDYVVKLQKQNTSFPAI